jgi:hypothetical protein
MTYKKMNNVAELLEVEVSFSARPHEGKLRLRFGPDRPNIQITHYIHKGFDEHTN